MLKVLFIILVVLSGLVSVDTKVYSCNNKPSDLNVFDLHECIEGEGRPTKLFMFDDEHVKITTRFDSATYNFSQYFDNKWAMNDNQVISLGDNALEVQSRADFTPVYRAYRPLNGYWYYWTTLNDPAYVFDEVYLMGYLSNICYPGMVAVCSSGQYLALTASKTRFGYFTCERPDYRYGAGVGQTYTTQQTVTNYCTRQDFFLGFTWHNNKVYFSETDIIKLNETEIPESEEIVVLHADNASPVEQHLTYTITDEASWAHTDSKNEKHSFGMEISSETKIGNDASPVSETVTVSFSYGNEVESGWEKTLAGNNIQSTQIHLTLDPLYNTVLKKRFKRIKTYYRGHLCFGAQQNTMPYKGQNLITVGHGEPKLLYLQPTTNKHLFTAQMCFTGEFTSTTNKFLTYSISHK